MNGETTANDERKFNSGYVIHILKNLIVVCWHYISFISILNTLQSQINLTQGFCSSHYRFTSATHALLNGNEFDSQMFAKIYLTFIKRIKSTSNKNLNISTRLNCEMPSHGPYARDQIYASNSDDTTNKLWNATKV